MLDAKFRDNSLDPFDWVNFFTKICLTYRNFPAAMYLFKINKRNFKTMCKTYSKLTIKIPEQHCWSVTIMTTSVTRIANYCRFQYDLAIDIKWVKTFDPSRATRPSLWTILLQMSLNHFMLLVSFYSPWNQRFSDVFRGNKKRPVA